MLAVDVGRGIPGPLMLGGQGWYAAAVPIWLSQAAGHMALGLLLLSICLREAAVALILITVHVELQAHLLGQSVLKSNCLGPLELQYMWDRC